MYYVYAIKSISRKYIYVGITSNLTNRLERHNKGYERTTRIYRPFELIYKEPHPNRLSARLREKYLKSGVGKEFLRNLK